MSTITTRSGKGSPLTNNEVDNNFTNLNTDKAELSGATFTGEIVANAGIDVTGTVTADGLTVDDGEALIRSQNSTDNSSVPTLRFDDVDTSQGAGQKAGQILFESSDVAPNSNGVYAYINAQATNTSGTGNLFFGTGVTNSAVNRLRIADNGDVSFYEDTGTTAKFFWDASAERLNLTGDGTSLSLLGATQNIAGGSSNLKIGSSDAAAEDKGGQLNFTANTTTLSNYPVAGIHGYHETLGASNYSGYLSLFTTSSAGGITERMRIDSSGNVGIGTDSPSYALDVSTVGHNSTGELLLTGGNSESNDYTQTSLLRLRATSINPNSPIHNSVNAAVAEIRFNHQNLAGNASSGNLTFYTNPGNNIAGALSERMRIDSSGNLLVGKSGSSLSTAGFELYSSGVQWMTSANARPLLLNRTGSDGAIQEFRKDGTTVGSIGTNSAVMYLGSDDVGLRFDATSNALSPWNTTTAALNDGGIDLGRTTGRFKDLYLSGTATMDGLTVSTLDSSVIKLESTGEGLGANAVIGDLQFYGNDASAPGAGIKASITATTVSALGDDSQLMFSTSNGTTNNVNRMLIANNGEIRTSNAVIVGRIADRQAQAVGVTDATIVLAGNSNTSGAGEEIGKVAFYTQDASGAGHNLAATVKALTNSAIGANADLVFSTKQGAVEGAEALESMRIDSSGNVGIGTGVSGAVSPILRLGNAGTSGGVVTGTLSLGSYSTAFGSNIVSSSNFTSNSSSYLAFGTTPSGAAGGSQPTERMRIASNGDVSFYEDTGTTAKLFWDASKESLGIGTTSLTPTDGANIELSSATSARVILDSTGENGSKWTMASGIDGSLAFYDYDASAYRMRIDSSGNVLVGKSGASKDTVGAELKADGRINATMSSGSPLLANRKTSDGDIATFQKDGTTVGSIGTRANLLTIGNGDTGLLFNGTNDSIIPESMSGVASRDAAIDLGHTSARFKDLYLSGGVYLGGTGAANKLDDYEEGTWIPTYSSSAGSFGTTSYNMQVGRYVKVGNMVMVTCQIRINTFSVGTASGSVLITGLPFTAQAESSTGLASVPLNTQQNWLTAPTTGFVSGSGATILLTRIADGGGTYAFIDVSDMSPSGTSINRLRFSAVYYAV